jgi:2,2-dialkylglycine decarboxylase (pyruvate)
MLPYAQLCKDSQNFLAPVTLQSGPILSRGNGSYVWDSEGKRYLDMGAGQFCAILGHSHPDLAKFITRQSIKNQNTSTTTVGEEAVEASRTIHQITLDMDGRSVFLSTGAEANECCLRYSKHLTGRSGVISFDQAWHGMTLGTECLSISRKHVKPPIQNTYSVPVPPVRDGGALDLDFYVDAFSDIVLDHPDSVAAAIFEPIVSSGGMFFPPKEYFQRVLEICRQHDILFILDECQTGFGRTGSWFYYEQLGIVPDFVVCGKGMGLGYPASAVIFNGRLVPDEGFKMKMYSSHQNDPFNCGLVNFAVDWITKHNILATVRRQGDYFLSQLTDLSLVCPLIHQPRGRGLMLAFDLVSDHQVDCSLLSERFLAALLNRGCLAQAANAGRTIRLLPSYLITTTEIDQFIDAVQEVSSDVSF